MEIHYSQKKRKPLTKMTLPQFLRLVGYGFGAKCVFAR